MLHRLVYLCMHGAESPCIYAHNYYHYFYFYFYFLFENVGFFFNFPHNYIRVTLGVEIQGGPYWLTGSMGTRTDAGPTFIILPPHILHLDGRGQEQGKCEGGSCS